MWRTTTTRAHFPARTARLTPPQPALLATRMLWWVKTNSSSLINWFVWVNVPSDICKRAPIQANARNVQVNVRNALNQPMLLFVRNVPWIIYWLLVPVWLVVPTAPTWTRVSVSNAISPAIYVNYKPPSALNARLPFRFHRTPVSMFVLPGWLDRTANAWDANCLAFPAPNNPLNALNVILSLPLLISLHKPALNLVRLDSTVI